MCVVLCCEGVWIGLLCGSILGGCIFGVVVMGVVGWL